jgi:hypothetical protein
MPDKILLATLDYQISECFISGRKMCFLDRRIKEGDHISLSNITSGSYDECLEQLRLDRGDFIPFRTVKQ